MKWMLKAFMFLGDKQCSTDGLETILNVKGDKVKESTHLHGLL